MPPVPVLLSHAYPGWGGDKAQMVELAAGLDPARFIPLVVTTSRGALIEECEARGVPTLVLPASWFRRADGVVGYMLRGPLGLRRVLRERGIGIVHAYCDYSTIPLARAARGRGLPFIQHLQDTDRAWMSRRRAPWVRDADAVIGCSASIARWLEARGVAPARIAVVHNGVPLEPYLRTSRRDAVRAELGLHHGDVAVGVFARLEPARKGQDEMMRAIASLAGDTTLRLVLVGMDDSATGDWERGLRALAAELGLRDRVRFLGQRRDVADVMSAMDILGAPFHREGFGRVVVEGMATGLPVIGFRSGALPEIVREGEDGLLVDEGDVAQLAAALASLAGDDALRRAMGERGRVRARYFSHERHVAEVQAVYDAVLAHRAARG